MISTACQPSGVILCQEVKNTNIQGQSGPESNGNKEVLHRAWELEPYYQMQLSAIPRIPLLFGGGGFFYSCTGDTDSTF